MRRPLAVVVATLLAVAAASPAADLPAERREFLETYCAGCHDATIRKGGLDLSGLRFDPDDPATFARWVTVHDRVRDGEMPPASEGGIEPEERRDFLEGLGGHLAEADRERARTAGRAVWRRLNRYEYENTLRDRLSAPWLQLRDRLPEDGLAHRLNKSGAALTSRTSTWPATSGPPSTPSGRRPSPGPTGRNPGSSGTTPVSSRT